MYPTFCLPCSEHPLLARYIIIIHESTLILLLVTKIHILLRWPQFFPDVLFLFQDLTTVTTHTFSCFVSFLFVLCPYVVLGCGHFTDLLALPDIGGIGGRYLQNAPQLGAVSCISQG